MKHILAALPCDSAHVGGVVATSFRARGDVETAAAAVPRWHFPVFSSTDTKDNSRHQRGDRHHRGDPDGGAGGGGQRTQRRTSPRRRRPPLELGVRAAGYRTLCRREFITVREIATFLRETDPNQSRQSNFHVRINTITIGGAAALRSQELKGVLQRCPHVILKHIVPQKHRRYGDIHATVEPILDCCSPAVVTQLELSWCSFKIDEVRVLQQLLRRFKNVTRLTLRDLHLERNGIVLLVQAIEVMTKLTYLDVGRNMMRRLAFPVLLTHIAKPDTLTTLIIDDNNMENTDELGRILSSHKRLEVLRMRHVNVSAAAAPMFSTVEDPPMLKEFDIGDNMLEDGCEHVVSFLHRQKRLEVLSMDRCGLDAAHALSLCAALQRMNITSLNVSFNKLTPEAGKAMAGAVRRFHNLRTLDLTGNRMNSDGVKPILEALLTPSSVALEVLNMAQMGLDDSVAVPLTRVVRKSHSMKELDLSFNFVTSSTILLLAPSLNFTPSMKIIDLRGNDIDHHVCDPLCGVCKSMHVLEYLYMDGNDIDDDRLYNMSVTVNSVPGMHVVGIGLPDFEGEEARYRRTVSDAVRRRRPGEEEDTARP